MKIGIDFDNTIICYDEVFCNISRRYGYVQQDFQGGKSEIKNKILTLDSGEEKWQALQGFVYGQGVADAKMFNGFKEFLIKAKEWPADIVIVSHKTQYGHFDPLRINLRQAALKWIEENKLLFPNTCLRSNKINFYDTFDEKINAINGHNFDYLIDDLIKVLRHRSLSASLKKILFNTNNNETNFSLGNNEIIAFNNWNDISNYIFNN